MNEKDDVHEYSTRAVAAQPKQQLPYHPADQKLFAFSLATPSMLEMPRVGHNTISITILKFISLHCLPEEKRGGGGNHTMTFPPLEFEKKKEKKEAQLFITYD